jgi:hypothetical protein
VEPEGGYKGSRSSRRPVSVPVRLGRRSDR